jgi:antirestriction protein ArdC
MTTKTDVYERVTNQILDALTNGVVPWQRPWTVTGPALSMSTGKTYRGINPFLLAIASQVNGWTSPYFGTYKKIAELGGQVRKGEKSTMVTFWKTGIREQENTDTGQVEEKRWAVLRSYLVFNADQADGLPAKYHPVTAKGNTAAPLLAPANVMADYFTVENAPTLEHGGDRAAYNPARDTVLMPVWEAFESAEAYYSTAFHEMTHSTGHSNRLAREGITELGDHRFGDEAYCKEELIAEMGAAFLCGHTGIEQATIDRSAAYLDNWVKVLKGDSRLVVSAAGAAQRAVDLILGTKFDSDNNQED